ncbi:26405_t:CDS:2, partial [Racocetra persica]
EIKKIHENAEFNKKMASLILARAEAIITCINELMRDKDNDSFRRREFYAAFTKLSNNLKKMKDFLSEVTQIKEQVECMKDLEIVITIENQKELEKVEKEFDRAINEAKYAFDNINNKIDQLVQEVSI